MASGLGMWYPVNKKAYWIWMWSWAIQWSLARTQQKSQHLLLRTNLRCPKGMNNLGQNQRQTNYILQMPHCTPQGRKSQGGPPKIPRVCAHPQRRGGCRSPASRPGTGISRKCWVAATPPYWSPQSRLQVTLIPITTYPSSIWISHHWWMGKIHVETSS